MFNTDSDSIESVHKMSIKWCDFQPLQLYNLACIQPVQTVLIQEVTVSSVSYGVSTSGLYDEYWRMQAVAFSTLTVSTVYAIIRVSIIAKWALFTKKGENRQKWRLDDIFVALRQIKWIYRFCFNVSEVCKNNWIRICLKKMVWCRKNDSYVCKKKRNKQKE